MLWRDGRVVTRGKPVVLTFFRAALSCCLVLRPVPTATLTAIQP